MVNSPPKLTANNPLTTDRCASGIITNVMLAATDVESGPAELVYTVGPEGSPPHNGTLKLNGIDLASGETFTQEDIDSNMLTYQHDCNCGFIDDFQFNVTDAHEGSAPPPPFTTYTFNIVINHPNRRPVAHDGTIAVFMGTTYDGTLSATNDDCVEQTLTFSIVKNGDKGMATIVDVNAGTFTYVSNPGEIGEDSFTFQVNDGIDYAVAEGNISVNIKNRPPAAHDDSGTTSENVSFRGTVSSTDLDLPPQALTYSIDTNGTKGIAVITDSSTGDFTYTPDPGAIGMDTITFTVNEGFDESAPATFTISIRPNMDIGDILVTDQKARALILIDPNTGDQAIISSGGLLSAPCGLAIENSGTFLISDWVNGLIRVNPDDGQQTLVTSGPFQIPIAVAVESSGNILVTDGPEGVKRFDPSGNLLDTFSGGNIDFSSGIDIFPNGDIYVSDTGAYVDSNNKILHLDPITGDQNVITYNGYLRFPVGIDHDSSGNIIVADAGPMAGAFTSSIIKVMPGDGGNQIVLSEDLYLSSPFDVALNNNGDIFVANKDGSSIIKVDPVSGDQNIIASGGNLKEPFGIVVVRKKDISIEMHLSSGWSLISLPADTNASVKELFPDAQAVFKFTTKYELLDLNDSLEKGKGYWINISGAKTYTINGIPFKRYTIPNCPLGWSMIGGCSCPVKPSVNNGEIRAIFGFSNKYDLLGPEASLEPGKGYWINLSEETTLTVE